MTILPWRSRHPRAERLAAAGVTRGLVLTAVSLPLACGPTSDSRDAADAVVETETIGDTTVVRTVSGSAWGGDATLVPETSIGELEGPEEYLFGSVSAIAVDDDHNVYVLDGQASHVRVFDSAGTYVATLGRRGEGPAEFEVPDRDCRFRRPRYGQGSGERACAAFPPGDVGGRGMAVRTERHLREYPASYG